MTKLGVNIDHIATLRQARKEFDPDPITAARICELAGADSIVAHLREDRRHIQDRDIERLRKSIKTKFNLEMSINPGIIKIACRIKPDQATLVPERRAEITTEGGLNVIRYAKQIESANRQLTKRKIEVSLFIDADKKQIAKTHELGINAIELHTGTYDHAATQTARLKELNKLKLMTRYAKSLGMNVFAGHGLKYDNVKAVAAIHDIEELNIGHSIVARAVFVGLKKAVQEMKGLIA